MTSERTTASTSPKIAKQSAIGATVYPTKLEAFIKNREIKPVHLARESDVSRQHLQRVRYGTAEPTRRFILAVVRGCRRITNEPITANDLFDLEGEL